jgi:hypothetical protein
VACRKLDLTTWKRLPFSTVFYDGEHSPGSPAVGRFSSSDPVDDSYPFNNLSTQTLYECPWSNTTLAGLPFEENFNYPGLTPERLVAAFESENAGTLRPPQSLEERRQTGLPLEGLNPASGVIRSIQATGVNLQARPVLATINPDSSLRARLVSRIGNDESIDRLPPNSLAVYSPLMVSTPGVYLFKVKYRQLRPGDLVLRAVSGDGKDFPRQSCLSRMEGDCPVKYLEVKLDAEEAVQLQLINQISTDPAGSEFLIEEIQVFREKNPLWEVALIPDAH